MPRMLWLQVSERRPHWRPPRSSSRPERAPNSPAGRGTPRGIASCTRGIDGMGGLGRGEAAGEDQLPGVLQILVEGGNRFEGALHVVLGLTRLTRRLDARIVEDGDHKPCHGGIFSYCGIYSALES